MRTEMSDDELKYHWKQDYCKLNNMNPDNAIWLDAADRRYEETRPDRERQRKQNESY